MVGGSENMSMPQAAAGHRNWRLFQQDLKAIMPAMNSNTHKLSTHAQESRGINTIATENFWAGYYFFIN